MLTDKEENLKLRKPFEGLLEYMNDRLQNGMEDDGPDGMCEHNVYFGFGTDSVKHMAKIYVCPETYEILEEACHHILEYIDEEYPATEPIGRIVKSYHINETEDPADAWYVWGQLTDGRWFGFEHPNGEVYMMEIFDNEKDAEGYYPLKVCEEIYPNDSRWMMAWTEILDDYGKHGADANLIEAWKNDVYDRIMYDEEEEE